MPLIVAKTKARGLFTAPNELSAVPDGALLRAKNTVIDDNGVLESRRGFVESFTLPTGSDRARRFGFYEDKILVGYSNGKAGYWDGSSFTAYSGTYNNPDDTLARTRFVGANSNMYFTSSSGVYKIDSYTATPALAGMYKGLDIEVSVSGASGFLANNFAVAYRVVWGIKDANNNVVSGAPSGRAEIYNTAGGTRDVALTVTIPTGITTDHFFQVYRSQDTDNSSATIVPDDELGLIYEANPTSGEITAGAVSFTDIAVESLRGETIYTAPSQQGILQSNELPPVAWDMTQFENQMVYANVESKYRLRITIVATSGTAGIQTDDTVTIAGTTYTAKGTEAINSLEYKLYTAGTPAQDIADTAKSLIRVINRNTTNTTVYAYYLSGQNDLPGQILIEERGIGGASFAATASANGGAYNPTLPTSGTTVSSENDNFQHYLMYSKSQQPEAVPLLNFIPVGSANDKILRVFALRNSLFVFKEREGIFRLTGPDLGGASAELFDSSARLLAPDSIAVVNNNVWGLSDQGEIRISESGVSVTSRPIEDGVLDPTGTARDQMRQYSFGVGYETDRKYLLWAAKTSADTSAPISWVYNTFTEAFTEWDRPALCGDINPADDKLYYAPPTSNSIFVERKTKTRTDYVDEAITTSISSYTTTTVILADATGVKAGDLLWQSSSKFSVISTVSLSTSTVVVVDSITWDVAAVSILKGIDVDIEWAPVFGDSPGTLKQFADFAMLFRRVNFETASVRFATDISPNYESVTISGSATGAWGLFAWGSGAAWGGISVPKPIRTYVPLEKSRGTWLRVRFEHRQGYGDFQLNGFSLPYTDTESFKVVL
jgi:hypothetical protein